MYIILTATQPLAAKVFVFIKPFQIKSNQSLFPLYSVLKNQYEKFKEITGAQGVKILAKDLEKALAGMPLLVAQHPDEVDFLKVSN